MIVVDASVVIEVLLRLETADAVLDRIFASGETLHAPQLIDVEVAQVIRRYWRAGDISARRGAEAVQDLVDLPVQRYAHEPLIARVWELRHNVAAYDATYIALAEALDAPLLTRDRALARLRVSAARVDLV